MSMDAEKQAELLKERYGRNRAQNANVSVVPQHLLIPTTSDPNIWRLRCRPGKEREIIMAVTKRMEDRANTKDPIPIISAFERSGPMQGSIYVEARGQLDVTASFDGIQHVFLGTKPQMIVLNEMTDLLRVRKTKALEPGQYVRIRTGIYSGDLAQVIGPEEGLEVEIKVVPRIDWNREDDMNDRRKKGGPAASAVRPAPKHFNPADANKSGSGRFLSTVAEGVYNFKNQEFDHGFLIAKRKIKQLQVDDVNPTLEEVTRFVTQSRDGTDNLDLSDLAAKLKGNTTAAFQPGDSIEIYKGEQAGVVGRASDVTGDIVRIMVTDGPLQGQAIDAPISGLRKLFREGDHVKVIGGSAYFDEVGMVVKIVDDKVTILTDSNHQEVTVFSRDLREATDSGGQVGLSKYDVHDLVQLEYVFSRPYLMCS